MVIRPSPKAGILVGVTAIAEEIAMAEVDIADEQVSDRRTIL
jgi:hypothetical protein